MNSPVSSELLEEDLSINQRKLPFISIVLYNYSGKYIDACLTNIFQQSSISEFEVIICDDQHDENAWETAVKYANKYDGKITLARNNTSIGAEANRKKGLNLSRGKYAVQLTESADFDAKAVLNAIFSLEEDEFLDHGYIARLKPSNIFIPNIYIPTRKKLPHDISKMPLVSICIYNFNYGRYLKECFESVFNQTYANIEVCFSDNASTDDSWEIALEYARKYPDRVNLTKNRTNYGPSVNLWNCMMNVRGKYTLKLCSDDAIKPDFVERCVSLMEAHPETCFTMVHREIIDENSTPQDHEAPFYESSCLIPSSGQAAVYMMSSVNPSVSQIFYRMEKLEGKRMAGNLNDRWFGDRLMDFHMCCESPILYIKEPLLLNRVHGASDSSSLDNNLLQCLGEYVLVHQLSDIASTYPGLETAVTRLPAALDKLGQLCMRYSLRKLMLGQVSLAKRYLHLGLAIFPDVEEQDIYKGMAKYFGLNESEKPSFLEQLVNDYPQVVKREHSYPVPEGSQCFN